MDTSGSCRRRATLRSTTSTGTTAAPTATWRSTAARIRRRTSASGSDTPIGHWEGNALVVETTNFTNKTRYQGASENMTLTERFTMTGSDTVLYRATIEDPTVFSAPWTIEVPLSRLDNQENKIYEAACHEGNYAMTSILAGARLNEQ